MLLKASNGKLEEAEKELFKIVSAFPKDFHHADLKMDLQYLAAQELNCKNGLEDLKSFMRRREVQKWMPQATKALQIILVSPATNAVSEKSFSKMKLLKTHLRASCGNSRLVHLMVCSIHKEITMTIQLHELANIFVKGVENRKHVFGEFSVKDFSN